MSNILNCNDNFKIINFLQNRNLLNKTARCNRCFIEMEWEERLSVQQHSPVAERKKYHLRKKQ